MGDQFSSENYGVDAPAYRAVAVSPSDSVALATDARSLYAGTAGNIMLVTSGGDTVTFMNIPAGSILPIRTHQVIATGTTATNIVAMW